MTVADQILDLLEFHLDCPIDYVTGSEPLSTRFAKLRGNYAAYQRAVDQGAWTWMHGDPYMIADWLAIFTPIEYDAWCEIRDANLPMWPQLPVGRFFVDFGNPVAKVALECDGKEWHDAAKDAERDEILRKMGWRVLRVTGSQCYKTRVMLPPYELEARGEDVDDDYAETFHEETIAGTIRQLRWIFDEVRV